MSGGGLGEDGEADLTESEGDSAMVSIPWSLTISQSTLLLSPAVFTDIALLCCTGSDAIFDNLTRESLFLPGVTDDGVMARACSRRPRARAS